MKNFLSNPIVAIIVAKVLLLLVAWLFVQLHLTSQDLEEAQDAIIHHHAEHHPELLGLSPGCKDEWAEFWQWLSGNACAGGSTH